MDPRNDDNFYGNDDQRTALIDAIDTAETLLAAVLAGDIDRAEIAEFLAEIAPADDEGDEA